MPLTRLFISMTVLFLATPTMAETAPDVGTQEILQSFADDWSLDPMFREGTFGIRVGEGHDWHVVATAATGDSGRAVALREGLPPEPAWFFAIDNVETLARIESGQLAPGTAAVKAFSTDFAPMDVDFTEGFQPDGDFVAGMLQTLFHFWNRGTPEITIFGEDNTRQSHGTDVAILYYQPGFRSGWFSIKPGDHVNENPDSRTNPFPSVLVITRGEGIARLDGEDHVIGEGQSLYIPVGMSHEFLNPGNAPVEGILLMFGDEA